MTARTKEERILGSDRLRRLLPYVGLILFAGALYVIYRELRGFQYADVADYLSELSGSRIAIAIGLTAINFWLLTGYDRLAMAYIRSRLPYHRVALASFIGYSFSVALGHAYLTGGAVRYRLYSLWGLSGTDIAKVIAFCGASFWIGFTALGGVLFTAAPFPVPPGLQLPVSLRPLGILLLLILLGYLLMSLRWRRPVGIGEWTFEIPNIRLTTGQGTIAVVDLALSAGILYILLPQSPEVSPIHVLSVFLLAIISGLISQVPGGLGVFDSVVLILLTPPLDPAAVLGALLAFRGIYYLMPLLTGAAVFAATEVLRQRMRVQEVSRRITELLPRTVAPVLAMLTFLTGILLLVGTVLPLSLTRAEALRIPWLMIEMSHLGSAIIGMLLLFVAIGLHRKLAAAFVAAVALLAVAAVLSVFRGGWEEAIAVAAVMAAFVPCRSFFYRRRPMFAEPFGAGFASALLAVVIMMTWLGLLVYQEVEVSLITLLHVGADADAGRFLRAFAGAVTIGLLTALAHRLMPTAPEGVLLDELVQPRVQTIIATSERSDAHLALLGDKYLLFNDSAAFVMYGVRGRSWIAMGDPVGSAADREELAWRFRSIAHRRGGVCAFYEVRPENAAMYLDLGLALFKLGEEARVSLADFTVGHTSLTGLQQNIVRHEEAGMTLDIVDGDTVSAILPRLRQVSDEWLNARSSRERAFSLGHFSEEYLVTSPVAVVRWNGSIVAFANIWPAASRTEVAVDMIRYTESAPAGVMDFLFTQLILWARAEGFQWFNLGMAPFEGMEERALMPLWTRAGELLYRHGEHFYNFQALRSYKQKFDPVWEPRYVAAPGGVILPRVLRDTSALISGGMSHLLAP